MYESNRTLQCGLDMLLDTKIWADCIFHFKTDGKNVEIKAHKLILATASPVFRAMFYGEMSNDLPIEIEDILHDVFCIMIAFIYNGRFGFISYDKIYELYFAADKYMLPLLKKRCVEELIRNLNASNACRNYEFTGLYNIPVLRLRATMVLLTETSAVLESATIEDVMLRTLIMILTCEKLNISSETELFDPVMRWARKECQRRELTSDKENLREIVNPVLRKIRFLTYSLNEFGKGPAASGIFTEYESLSISLNIVNGSTSFSMPEGFSNLTQERQTGSEESAVSESKPEVEEKNDWPLELGERLKYLLESEQFTDCSFVIIEKDNNKRHIFRAHRLIISMMSLKFRDLVSWNVANSNETKETKNKETSGEKLMTSEVNWFKELPLHEDDPDDTRETENSDDETYDDEPIQIADVSPENFKNLLEFIYSGRLDIKEWLAPEVCDLSLCAYKFNIPLLVDQCIERMSSILDVSTACKIYATLKQLKQIGKSSDLLNQSCNVIVRKTSAVIMAPSFEDIELNTLYSLLNTPQIAISSEAELFDALMRWTKKECRRRALAENNENLRDISYEALKKIRFLDFSVKEFAEGPAESKILTPKESLHILMNIAGANVAYFLMPEGFSTEGKR